MELIENKDKVVKDAVMTGGKDLAVLAGTAKTASQPYAVTLAAGNKIVDTGSAGGISSSASGPSDSMVRSFCGSE